MGYILGTDVGGTFTDFLLADESHAEHVVHKVPSTPDDPSIGLMAGIRQIAERLGRPEPDLLGDISLIVHGTTVATNAVLTETGARTGLMTTKGFRDVLEMRRGVRSREYLYDNKYVAPSPLVPRQLRQPITERNDVDGTTIQPLDETDVRRAAERLLEADVAAVAVSFMHSYMNPAHEQRAGEIVSEVLPDAFVTCSSDVLAQMRLFERTSTAVINAYVGPVVRRYIDRLARELDGGGFRGTLLVMQSNGGVATAEVVSRLPASVVLSGPAAGPVAGLEHMRQHDAGGCIVVDMGGTSFDASLVRHGSVQLTQEGEINRQKVALPMTYIHTIGAGGGSIGWVDEGSLLRVGPHSAGADPGPACYGLGGTEPTVTDANLVLGYLNPHYFLGGTMALDTESAYQAIEKRLAKPLGVSTIEAAAGIYDVVNQAMAAGTKDISVQRGYDPREFALVVAGGAGPVHAGRIAMELDIATVVIPITSATFCAAGMLLADLRHDYVRSYLADWHGLDMASARHTIDEMERQGSEALRAEGVFDADQESYAVADMRYAGQHHEVSVPFQPADIETAEGRTKIAQAFHVRHEELYGFATADADINVINLRVTSIGRRYKLDLHALAGSDHSAPPQPSSWRPVYQPAQSEMVDTPIYRGDTVGTGHSLRGPAVVEQRNTTIVLPEGFSLALDSTGSFTMRRIEGGSEPVEVSA